ncbi:MAG TPA: pirin-like C-terminal cupin domain-containing protein, partial [Kiloniellales bacterium]|nr:pirin-like C-terminal cupin domain-containing protein [Kiloniellales bacterium]
HSERTAPGRRRAGEPLFGIQAWIALPDAAEDSDPAFEHVAEEQLPLLDGEGKSVRLILGSLYGAHAPVRTFSEMFYADARLEETARLALPAEHAERALYIVEGEIEIADERYEAGRMIVFRPGDDIVATARGPARLMLLGGAPFETPRHIWWNFVASSRERIEAAKVAWAAGDWTRGRFRLPPADDREFIPLPNE